MKQRPRRATLAFGAESHHYCGNPSTDLEGTSDMAPMTLDARGWPGSRCRRRRASSMAASQSPSLSRTSSSLSSMSIWHELMRSPRSKACRARAQDPSSDACHAKRIRNQMKSRHTANRVSQVCCSCTNANTWRWRSHTELRHVRNTSTTDTKSGVPMRMAIQSVLIQWSSAPVFPSGSRARCRRHPAEPPRSTSAAPPPRCKAPLPALPLSS